MKAVTFAASLIALLLNSLPSSAVLFTDGDFNMSDWTLYQAMGNGPAADSQILTGGNPDKYIRVDHNNFSDTLIAYHIKPTASWNPSTQGQIFSVDFQIDVLPILNHAGVGVAHFPALKQNGKYFSPNAMSWFVNNAFYWGTNYWSGIMATDFSTLSNANDHPDFSMSGSTIEFGFVTGNSNDGALTSRAAGFDNYWMNVNAQIVPEPSSLLGLSGVLFGGLGAVLRLRRG